MTGLRVFAAVLLSTAVSQACSFDSGILVDAGIHSLLAGGTHVEIVAQLAGCPDVAALEAYLVPAPESYAVISSPFQSSAGLTEGTFVSRMSFDTQVTSATLTNVPLAGAWGASAALQLPEGCTVSGLGLTCGSSMNGSLAWSRVDWLGAGFDSSSSNPAFGGAFSSFSGCNTFGGFGSLGLVGSASSLAVDGNRAIVPPTTRIGATRIDSPEINTPPRAGSRWIDRDDRGLAVRHELPSIGTRPDVSSHGLTRAERVHSKFER